MEIHVAEQGLIFVGMFLCGIGFGLVFDCFRALRKLLPMNNLWVNLTDLMFWIICTVFVFVTARVTNQGELRWYEFIGLFLGTGLYFLLFGSLMATWMATLLRLCFRILAFLFRVLSFPVRLILTPVRKLVQKTAPFRKRLAFSMSVRRQKWLFTRQQLKKILKSPKFF